MFSRLSVDLFVLFSSRKEKPMKTIIIPRFKMKFIKTCFKKADTSLLGYSLWHCDGWLVVATRWKWFSTVDVGSSLSLKPKFSSFYQQLYHPSQRKGEKFTLFSFLAFLLSYLPLQAFLIPCFLCSSQSKLIESFSGNCISILRGSDEERVHKNQEHHQ